MEYIELSYFCFLFSLSFTFAVLELRPRASGLLVWAVALPLASPLSFFLLQRTSPPLLLPPSFPLSLP